MIKSLMLSSLLAVATVASGASLPLPAATGPANALEASRGLYYAGGTARVVSSITGREKTVSVSALITANSLGEARSYAREALAANAAIYGRVIQVYVRTVH
jgi:thymidine phosphorylase